jgi:hypothetical protein
MSTSRKLRDAAVSFTRTSLGPGVGTSLVSFVRLDTLDAVEGTVHAVLVFEDIVGEVEM